MYVNKQLLELGGGIVGHQATIWKDQSPCEIFLSYIYKDAFTKVKLFCPYYFSPETLFQKVFQTLMALMAENSANFQLKSVKWLGTLICIGL